MQHFLWPDNEGYKSRLLANKAFACMTPASFVIFVVFWGLKSKALVFTDRMYIYHVRRFRQNSLFLEGAKAAFAKSTVFVLSRHQHVRGNA